MVISVSKTGQINGVQGQREFGGKNCEAGGTKKRLAVVNLSHVMTSSRTNTGFPKPANLHSDHHLYHADDIHSITNLPVCTHKKKKKPNL